MAIPETGECFGIEASLFMAANKLRGHIEPADGKSVALGLVFPKHISDGFEQKRHQLLEEYPDGAEDPDEFLAENVIWGGGLSLGPSSGKRQADLHRAPNR